MKEHLLVTGGAGYIGSVLVPSLLEKGYRVTVIDHFMYRQTSLLDVCHHRNLEIVRGDARNESLITHHLKKSDVLLPLACLTGAPICEKHPEDARTVNLGAIEMLLKHKDRNQKIIFPTTNSGYGIGRRGKACTEESPLKPISLYGRLKVAAEKKVLDAPNSISLRLATVFGTSPRMRTDLLVNDFTFRAVFDGRAVLYEPHFIRNYIHVRDVAHAFLHSLENFSRMKNETYNVGLSDCNLSKLELCREIKKEIPGFQITVSKTGSDPDKRDYIVSNKKIEAAGFRPKYSLRMGIRELIKAYQILNRTRLGNV